MSDSLSPFAHHIHTNYVPSDSESNQIKALIQTRQQVIDDIDSELEELLARVNGLYGLRDEQSTYIDEHYALISPVRRLPDDILSAIFQTVCQDRPLPKTASPEYYVSTETRTQILPPAVTISHICRHWRALSLNMPYLWAWVPRLNMSGYPVLPGPGFPTLEQTSPPMPRVCTSGMSLGGERGASRNCHSMIPTCRGQASAGWTFPSPLRPLNHLDHGFEDISRQQGEYMRALLESSDRWKEIDLDLTVSSLRSPLLQFLDIPPSRIPLLKGLHLGLSLRIDLGHPTPTKALATSLLSKSSFTRACQITCLSLAMSSPDIEQLPVTWSCLTDLTISATSQSSIEFNTHFGWSTAVSTLAECPNLRTCTLTFQREPTVQAWQLTRPSVPFLRAPSSRPPTPPPPAILPYLEELNLRGVAQPPGLASSLTLPSLRRLSAIFTHSKAALPEESGLLEWVRLYGTQLTHATFDYLSLTQEALVQCLQGLTSVTSLKMLGHLADYTGPLDLHARMLASVSEPQETIRPSANLSIPVLTGLTFKNDKSDEAEDTEDCWCPRLERLECVMVLSDLNEQGFVDFIASRRRRSGPAINCVSQIKNVCLAYHGALRTFDFEGGLRAKGVETEKFGLKVNYHQMVSLVPGSHGLWANVT
ncbi:hypothetical protein DFP72DRAFT_544275 [Ephemerocybe angulata]|uniref:F-box domain-containing protein n=1 Tax=Ephemerocybe angulata TaxID=980116 RepID=A0A8H6M009_9AGAR|nr:hypothetical protein DFP72DRAFT_544275 [Tulosesus angulatus]